ncbi:hypothetical protein ANO11243_005570 [Dothideomycetidae sp. 11243]|nr:hypothetical protein ANO11243_005570 [fungal sp. No.11243]
MTAAVESWDDDGDFQGDLFAHSVSTVQTSLSSRLSVNSESNIADEDWHVQVTPNDDSSTTHAIQSAKRAGVPIPANVPASALVGGSIKRLGKKASRQRLDDEWGDDLDIPSFGGLTLKPRKPEPTPTILDDHKEDDDEFDEWAEGSLGIRFAGSRKQGRNRSSSTSAMSPSVGSQTAESEEDDLRGLELPDGMFDLKAMLHKRQEAAKTIELPDQIEQPQAQTPRSPKFLQETDDFFVDLEVGGGDVFDPRKLTLHKNIKQKPSRSQLATPARMPTTTLTFTDKPAATRIPRPVPSAKPQAQRLEPVMEPGATSVTRQRLQPTTTGSQLLRSKRSMPVMRSNYTLSSKTIGAFNQPGTSGQSHHVAAKGSAFSLRRDSDPNRGLSPPPRSFSRLSNAYVPDTPSRTSRRPDFAPKDLAREAAAKRTLTKPQKKRFFGDGTELELFDDLPTSASKESKFLKQPSMRNAPKALRIIPSRLDLREQAAGGRSAIPDRMTTPLPGPQTPRSPVKVFQEQNTPRYLRDTAASRIARESRLANASGSRPRSEGPLMPVSTNWKAQIAARSPHTSPSAARNKGRRIQPNLIKPSEANMIKTPIPSPPRPALIAPMSATGAQNIQVVGGMVFDPVRMCWLKFKPEQSQSTPAAKHSPQIDDDDEDPFAGIDDLKEGTPSGPAGSATASFGPGRSTGGLANDEWLVGEEFDLGPEFIRRQKEEEIIWRRRCEAWFASSNEGPRRDTMSWRWRIREIAGISR